MRRATEYEKQYFLCESGMQGFVFFLQSHAHFQGHPCSSKCCLCYLCPASHLIIHVSDTVWTPMQTLVPDVCFVTHKSLQNSISLMILMKAHLSLTLPSEALWDTADATGHDWEHKRVLCFLNCYWVIYLLSQTSAPWLLSLKSFIQYHSGLR